MKPTQVRKETKAFSAKVGRALKRAVGRAHEVARAHGTPVYIWQNGKVVAQKP